MVSVVDCSPGVLRLPSALADRGRRVVSSIADAYSCIYHGLCKLSVDSLTPAVHASALGSRLSGRVVFTSSCFSGVNANSMAHSTISGSARRFLETHCSDDPRMVASPITFVDKWVVEVNLQCQAELLHSPHGPEHVFSDVLDFLPQSVRPLCGLDGDTSRALPYTRLRQLLPRTRMKRFAHCCRHGKRCQAEPVHSHQASSPCVHHSKLGLLDGNSGKHMISHWAWLGLMRTLLLPLIVHENVPDFGVLDFDEFLSDLYVVIRSVADPTDVGFPVRRPRQFVVCIRKTFVFPALQHAGLEPTVSAAVELLDLDNSTHAIFDRGVASGFTYRDLIISPPCVLSSDFAWAANRPSVLNARSATCPLTFNDLPGSTLTFLSIKERERFQLYCTIAPGEACDVG